MILASRLRALGFGSILLLPFTTALAQKASPEKKYTPTQRMASVHLKQTHTDVVRLRASRRIVPPIDGLHDYRAILHAHAEDSAHTGGTRAEMLIAAKKVGVNAILLTNHHRPPTDFITQSWRGLHDGVLFIPGSEDRGFLLYPTHSIMNKMQETRPRFVETVGADGGLIFLSHVEERLDHPMDGLTGMEIYNRHYDAKIDTAGILGLIMKLTDPASLRVLEADLKAYPDELLASQVEYSAVYLKKWDAETAKRRLIGVAANDCHHNQILIVKVVDAETVRVGTNVDSDDQMKTISATLRPGVRELTKGKKQGEIVARLNFDPYERSFVNASTHILAPALEEGSVRDALRNGHAYVSHDWICDPTGFRFGLGAGDKSRTIMGDEVKFAPGAKLVAEFPVSCVIKLLRDGKVIADATADRFEREVDQPGVYRVEGWATLDGEERPWIYSNPIYVR